MTKACNREMFSKTVLRENIQNAAIKRAQLSAPFREAASDMDEAIASLGLRLKPPGEES